jgi:hypothetical protein
VGRTTRASATVYTRGTVETGFLGDEYDAYLHRQETDEPGLETDLVQAYFEHQVARLINLYILSGSRSIDSLTSLLETIVRVAFKIMLSRDKLQLRACDDIRATGSIRHFSIKDTQGARIELGVEGKSEPGKNIVLGVSTSDEIPRLEVVVELNTDQLRSLRRQLDVLYCIMEAFEDAVPLHLDFSLGFRMKPEDRSFRLVSPAATEVSGAEAPSLGITTMLGAG